MKNFKDINFDVMLKQPENGEFEMRDYEAVFEQVTPDQRFCKVQEFSSKYVERMLTVALYSN